MDTNKVFKIKGINFGTPYCEDYVIGAVKYHRNGISGAGFHTVSFRNLKDGKTFIAIRFDYDEELEGHDKEHRTAVICQNDDYFNEERISCWRGDHFEEHIDKAIKAYSNRRMG